MDDDEDDLLGTIEEPQDDDDDFEIEDDLPFASGGKDFKRSLAVTNVERALKGAPPEWFAKLLGIGRTTVNRKLEGLSPKHVSAKGNKYYDPKDALPRLVQPHDLKEHFARMSPRDMPERLRKEFWGARKLEQEVRLRSKDLWHTADVHRVLGDLMKILKDTVTLWTDELDAAVGLTSEQVEILDNLARKLLADYASAVSQYVEQGVTRSQEAELGEDDENE